MQHLRGIGGFVLGFSVCGAIGCDAQVDPEYRGEVMATLQGRVETTWNISAADVGVLWFASGPGDDCSGPTRVCLTIGYAFPDEERVACVTACGSQPDCADAEAIEVWQPCMAACGVAQAPVEYESNLSICSSSFAGQSVPVTGEFPAQFALDLLTEPPESALLPDDSGSRVALGYIVALEPGTTITTVEPGWEHAPEWLLGGSETHVLVYVAEPVDAGSGWATVLGGPLGAGYHLIQFTPEYLCPLLGSRVYGDEAVFDVNESDEEYYSHAKNVCGNGICEPSAIERETCDNCSDCVCSESGPSPTDSGLLATDPGYFCFDTDRAVGEVSDGLNSDITLTLTAEGDIRWPQF